MVKPIFLVGFMGCGKTAVAPILAKHLQCQAVDMDQEIEMSEAKPIAVIFSEQGADYFRMAERQCLELLPTDTMLVVACGGGTPCYHDNMTYLNSIGTTVHLSVDFEVCWERIANTPRPMLSENKQTGKQDALRLFRERTACYDRAKAHYKCGTQDVNSVALGIIALLAKHQENN